MSESDAEFLAKMDRLVLDYPIEFSPKRGEMADWSRLLSLARKGVEADALRAEVERLTGERDRQYDQNAEQIVRIAALEAEGERLRAALARIANDDEADADLKEYGPSAVARAALEEKP